MLIQNNHTDYKALAQQVKDKQPAHKKLHNGRKKPRWITNGYIRTFEIVKALEDEKDASKANEIVLQLQIFISVIIIILIENCNFVSMKRTIAIFFFIFIFFCKYHVWRGDKIAIVDTTLFGAWRW